MKKTTYIFFFLLLLLSLIVSTSFELSAQDESEKFTVAQDSAYARAMQMNIPAFLLFRDINIVWKYQKEQRTEDLVASIPARFFIPSGVEIVHHEEAIYASQRVPFVNTIPKYGLKIDMQDAFQILGLVRDVSPKITYNLEYQTEVEIVVYSIDAKVIATIFKGMQNAGRHTRIWNYRDDNGMKMPFGDYIAEVRIGQDRYIRKKISIK